MDTLYALLLSPMGRFLSLAVAIGLVMRGIKEMAAKGTWLRALLPLVSVLLGAICGLIPGLLTGEAALFLGIGAGAISPVAVEVYDRYQAQIRELDLKRLAKGAGDGGK